MILSLHSPIPNFNDRLLQLPDFGAKVSLLFYKIKGCRRLLDLRVTFSFGLLSGISEMVETVENKGDVYVMRSSQQPY